MIKGSIERYKRGIGLEKMGDGEKIGDGVILFGCEEWSDIRMENVRMDGGGRVGM
ncbi:hypothetical protein [Bacillus sp. WP8]|uniref:hypothetical protein n=1 Tax=Bacillus sp. WP8 TaxID=756828 RepID=UPI00164313EC|nr:hypothetical protein [Bacillus sp. WP8]